MTYSRQRELEKRRVKEARDRVGDVERYQDEVFDKAAYFTVTYHPDNNEPYSLDFRSLCEAIALASPLKPRALIYAMSDTGRSTLMPYTIYDKCLESWIRKHGPRYDPADQIFCTRDLPERWYCFVHRITYGPFLDEMSAKINMVRLKKLVETPQQ